MGQRILRVSPELLVDLMKGPGEEPRAFTVEHPLPADARLVFVGRGDVHLVELALESKSWPDDGTRYVDPVPVANVHHPAPEGGTA